MNLNIYPNYQAPNFNRWGGYYAKEQALREANRLESEIRSKVRLKEEWESSLRRNPDDEAKKRIVSSLESEIDQLREQIRSLRGHW